MDYLVVKEGDLLLLTDEQGNIAPDSEKGLYTHDTRMLDSYELTLNQLPLTLLHSSCETGYMSTIYLTNREQLQDGTVLLRRDSIEVRREQIVHRGVFYERITLQNYSRERVIATIKLKVGSTFNDLFEIRGQTRAARGRDLDPVVSEENVLLGYEGLDGITRRVDIHVSPVTETDENGFQVSETLVPGEPFIIEIAVSPIIAEERLNPQPFSESIQALGRSHADWLASCMQVSTDNSEFNAMVTRGLQDLRVLFTDLGDGLFPVAGIPWFAVPFGRDSLIAALQLLPFQPSVARATLQTLARLQGEAVNPKRAEQPGKILHEMRRGEMANLKEVPFGKYYGSIDSTPLFLVLVVEYFRWTHDVGFIRQILPNIMRAIEWLDEYADPDGDGFVEYHVEGSGGLSVQSWKDSYDSMIHVDGRIAVSPMAVVEVQGYVYHAKVGLAEVLEIVGESGVGARLKREAASLKKLFNQQFWMPQKDYFALALDKDKQQVQITTSDPGHCLWSGIVDEERIDVVANKLLAEDMFSGWGIRTVSAKETVFNPISYHNGSVWSHDNSIILLGLSKQRKRQAVNKLATGLLNASLQFQYQRLPELFCGHDASLGAIVPYPVACIPQAWASGTPLVMVQAILGLEIDVANRRVRLAPTWPDFVNRVEINHMPFADTTISFVVDVEEGLTVTEGNGVQIQLVAD